MKNWIQIEGNKYFYLAEVNETTNDNGVEVILPKFTKLKFEYIEADEVMFTVAEGERKGFDLYFYTNRDNPEDLLTEDEYQLVKGGSSVYWKDEIKKISKCLQRQDSLTDQMNDLYYVANKLGFYDAADFIREKFMGR